MTEKVSIIGGGMAGSEAAWQLAERGIQVSLYEMRPTKMTDAHHTGKLAELVCSNSLRSDDHETSAVGLLHEELRRIDSLILRAADETRVPAGGALAVDRESFSESVEKAIEAHPNITVIREEVTTLPDANDADLTLVASGPLTSPALFESLKTLIGEDSLSFYDAIAPIVYTESINMEKAWHQSRYDKGDGKDYINCGMNEEEYNRFIDALLEADTVAFKEFEKEAAYFEGCLPIEVMAGRGRETLTYGPMKPVGLTSPHEPEKRMHAVVQLRQDNALGTLRNIVGFQTKLSHKAQKEVFRLIPGLENAKFARLGGIHKNSFLNSPRLLDTDLSLKKQPNLFFAGQITGSEGYVENTAMGFMAALAIHARLQEGTFNAPPENTAMGALLRHVTHHAESDTFQPMNVNFGLFPPIIKEKGKKKLRGRDRKLARTTAAIDAFAAWKETL